MNCNILGSARLYRPVQQIFFTARVNVMPCVLMFVFLFHFSLDLDPSLKPNFYPYPIYNGAILTLGHVEMCVLGAVLFFPVLFQS